MRRVCAWCTSAVRRKSLLTHGWTLSHISIRRLPTVCFFDWLSNPIYEVKGTLFCKCLAKVSCCFKSTDQLCLFHISVLTSQLQTGSTREVKTKTTVSLQYSVGRHHYKSEFTEMWRQPCEVQLRQLSLPTCPGTEGAGVRGQRARRRSFCCNVRTYHIELTSVVWQEMLHFASQSCHSAGPSSV